MGKGVVGIVVGRDHDLKGGGLNATPQHNNKLLLLLEFLHHHSECVLLPRFNYTNSEPVFTVFYDYIPQFINCDKEALN